MSQSFRGRLFPVLKDIAAHYRTPFHIYDEVGIRETGRQVKETFSEIEGFQEYFAVKALPNPRILDIMGDMGFGFDCSSTPELVMSRNAGGYGEKIMFTSNNTSREEFEAAAKDGGCILNLDDITLVPKVPHMPAMICFRYNPGARRTGNAIIGNPVEAKYGVGHDQLIDAYRSAKNQGARLFGLHTMLASNELDYTYMVQTAEMPLGEVERVSEALGIRFEFINIGGGLGIPYRPEDPALDLAAMGREITSVFRAFETRNGYVPKLFLESGRLCPVPMARSW
jgi:diaminopimelate decarboxylase